MILKCIDCGGKIDTENDWNKLVKIGNSYKCIKCRGFRFIIEEMQNMSYMKRFLELEHTPCPFCYQGEFQVTEDLKLQCYECGVRVEVTKENLDKMRNG